MLFSVQYIIVGEQFGNLDVFGKTKSVTRIINYLIGRIIAIDSVIFSQSNKQRSIQIPKWCVSW